VNVSTSSSLITWVSALSLSGRFRTIRITAPSRWTAICS
jgi:hypothetical protein